MLYGQVLLYEQHLLFIYEKNEFKILTSNFLTRFGPFLVPRSAVGTYGLAFVCVCVRSAEISKSVHRNFLIFGPKLWLSNATEVTFSDFARKIRFGRFWPILVKNGHLWPKINVLANFSKSSHRIFLVLYI